MTTETVSHIQTGQDGVSEVLIQNCSNDSSLEQRNLLATSYPFDTSDKLNKLLKNYKKNGRAQNVSFRNLVNWIKVGERATHYIHSYPAKLLPQIAHFFLATELLSKKNDVVLDPFGGTGTVALEAILAGRNAYFSDINPLAQLIAHVKTHPIDIGLASDTLNRVKLKYFKPSRKKLEIPKVVNIDYWYDKDTIYALAKLKHAINLESTPLIDNFIKAAFSTTCRKSSKADPKLSVPVKLKESNKSKTYGLNEVWEIFEEQVLNNLKRMHNFINMHSSETNAMFVGNDARKLRAPSDTLALTTNSLNSNSVDLIITSPPYAGAQKYIRASSLNLGWLGFTQSSDLKVLENASIGREHYPKFSYIKCPETGIADADKLIKRVYKINPLRSKIIANYLNEMSAAILEMTRVLKPGGHLVLVIGNNVVCGLPFKSSEYLAELCEKMGLVLELKLIDEIKSRGLMTKRNKTASVITREWVLMFKKPSKI